MAVSCSERFRVSQFRDLGKCLAGVCAQRLVLEADEQRALATRREHQILPVILHRNHLSADALADLRIPQPLRPRVVAALLYPWGHRRIKARRSGGVGVHVGRDVQTILTCGFNLRDRRAELRPVRCPAGLQVIDFSADMRLASDSQCLVNRLEQTVAFTPHVRDVHPSGRRSDLREFHEFVRPGKHSRDVDERRR